MADELEGEDISISWDDARAANLANWNDRVPIHTGGGYDMDAFRRDPQHISQVVRTDLPVIERFLPNGVAGLDLCHLQCHIGTDTLSFARKGARVVGVDFSAPALEAAAGLASEIGLEAEWVCTDVLDARAAVTRDLGERTFDVIYTSIGTVWWLHDLDRWAAQIEALLKPGGIFFVRDGHPAMYSLDDRYPDLRTVYRYFGNGTAQGWDVDGSYIGEGSTEHTRNYGYAHPLSEILQALIGAGLELVLVDEGKTLPWRFSEYMVEREDGDFELPEPQRDLVPLTFTAVAHKREG
jgi:2-polyprenyl-3-methyl-5-hydroxy-6-metoxy-1,4-benzoquinol methylase